MKNWIMTAVCVAGVMTTVPAQAQISESLAKQCREMMIKAYPTQLYGTTGTAARQRDYFQQPMQALMTFLRSADFGARAKEMGGFDLSGTGTVRFAN